MRSDWLVVDVVAPVRVFVIAGELVVQLHLVFADGRVRRPLPPLVVVYPVSKSTSSRRLSSGLIASIRRSSASCTSQSANTPSSVGFAPLVSVARVPSSVFRRP